MEPLLFYVTQAKGEHQLSQTEPWCSSLCSLHFCSFCRKVNVSYFLAYLPSKQKLPPYQLFFFGECLWIFRGFKLERTWQHSSAVTGLAVDHRKWHGGCPSRPLAEWATQLKADCGGSEGAAFPRPTKPSSSEPGVLIAIIPSSADHLLRFTDWRWLNAWLDPMITSYHACSDITHKHTFTSTVQQMSV